MSRSRDETYVITRLEQLRDVPLRDLQAAASGQAAFLKEASSILQAGGVPSASPLKGRTNTIPELLPIRSAWTRASLRALVIVAALAILLFGGTAVTVHAAQLALPGNALYPVKTGLERAQLALTGDQLHNAELHLRFAEKRLLELEELVQQGRFERDADVVLAFKANLQAAREDLRSIAETNPGEALRLSSAMNDALIRFVGVLSRLSVAVPLENQDVLEGALGASREESTSEVIGKVTAIDLGAWEIERADDGSRLRVRLIADTEVEDGIAVGDLVRVEGIPTADGSLLGLEVNKVEKETPEAEQPTPSPSDTPREERLDDQVEPTSPADDGGAEGEEEIQREKDSQGMGENEGQDHPQDEHQGEVEQTRQP